MCVNVWDFHHICHNGKFLSVFKCGQTTIVGGLYSRAGQHFDVWESATWNWLQPHDTRIDLGWFYGSYNEILDHFHLGVVWNGNQFFKFYLIWFSIGIVGLYITTGELSLCEETVSEYGELFDGRRWSWSSRWSRKTNAKREYKVCALRWTANTTVPYGMRTCLLLLLLERQFNSRRTIWMSNMPTEIALLRTAVVFSYRNAFCLVW